MNILWLGLNDDTKVGSQHFYLREALKEHVNVQCYGPRWGLDNYKTLDVSKIVKIFGSDAIFIQGYWSPGKGSNPLWKNLDKVSIPKISMFSDPHNSPKHRSEWIVENQIDVSFHPYKNAMAFVKTHTHKEHQVKFMPWSVPTDIFKDYKFERKHDVAVLGQPYPLRKHYHDVLRKQNDLKIFHRPRPPQWGSDPKTALMRGNYAKAIARCKMFIFDTKRKYAILKYFESMGCKTLTLADIPMGAEELHFVPGVNFVAVDRNNFLKVVRYFKSHEEERLQIAQRGYETIRKYHTSEIRAKQFYSLLKKLTGMKR
ncbi:unnamed protein product [marine sediment metagenome]|uniref:Spore protein YkvP/CgeB glycosyl transferase-like domain-containing protein n=1 Tax=marine sediment metagenome TaxID=412755 RepID=X1B3M5_9ZZZZ